MPLRVPSTVDFLSLARTRRCDTIGTAALARPTPWAPRVGDSCATRAPLYASGGRLACLVAAPLRRWAGSFGLAIRLYELGRVSSRRM